MEINETKLTFAISNKEYVSLLDSYKKLFLEEYASHLEEITVFMLASSTSKLDDNFENGLKLLLKQRPWKLSLLLPKKLLQNKNIYSKCKANIKVVSDLFYKYSTNESLEIKVEAACGSIYTSLEQRKTLYREFPELCNRPERKLLEQELLKISNGESKLDSAFILKVNYFGLYSVGEYNDLILTRYILKTAFIELNKDKSFTSLKQRLYLCIRLLNNGPNNKILQSNHFSIRHKDIIIDFCHEIIKRTPFGPIQDYLDYFYDILHTKVERIAFSLDSY